MKRPPLIPRLAFGKLDDVPVRLRGDVDDSGFHLAGRLGFRMWHVHEVPPDGHLPIELAKRGLPNDASLEEAAAAFNVKLYGDPP